MSYHSSGRRDWRGVVIASPVALSDDVNDGTKCLMRNAATTDIQSITKTCAMSLRTAEEGFEAKRNADIKKKRQMRETRMFEKDEFGRDVEVFLKKEQDQTLDDEWKERAKKENKYKKQKRRRNTTSSGKVRSLSPRGRFVGTPPPPDPFRPQLDEGRDNRRKRYHYDDKNRIRSRSRSCRYKQRRYCEKSSARCGKYHRRESSWSRSRSRGRSQSRSSSRSHHRRSSVSVDRKWTHSAFDERSPSPPRELDPFYRPEPEAWVSRAGGVYLPRK